MKRFGSLFAVLALGACAAIGASPASAFKTSVKPYVKPIGSLYTIDPLLSAGDQVPQTIGAGNYRMVGIPDGLGAVSAGGSNVDLYVNHEFTNAVTSRPDVGAASDYRGAFVSLFRLGAGGDVISGQRAYENVRIGDAAAGDPAPTTANATRAFSRLCSGYLATGYVGFDRPIFMTGEEESSDANSFDPMGSSSVAVFDPDSNPATDNGEAHSLPNLGHFAHENQIVMPGTGSKTVVFILEDGPSSPDSQLYMWVGTKSTHASATVLEKNGLVDDPDQPPATAGKLYALKLGTLTNEDDLTSGQAFGTWQEIESAATLNSAATEAAADADGDFGFYRIEDGAYSKTSNRNFHFVTTGAGGTNRLGRSYQLTYDPANPAGGGALLQVKESADTVIGGGGDTAVSPDNIDLSSDFLMVNEDGTADSRLVMASRNRDGSVWRYPLASPFLPPVRVAELNPPGREGVAVGPGIWETSGVIDTASLYGPDSWIMDVQAHSPTAAPGSAAETVEDGQLVLMKPPAPAAGGGNPPPGPGGNPGNPGNPPRGKKCPKSKKLKGGKCAKKKKKTKSG